MTAQLDLPNYVFAAPGITYWWPGHRVFVTPARAIRRDNAVGAERPVASAEGDLLGATKQKFPRISTSDVGHRGWVSRRCGVDFQVPYRISDVIGQGSKADGPTRRRELTRGHSPPRSGNVFDEGNSGSS